MENSPLAACLFAIAIGVKVEASIKVDKLIATNCRKGHVKQRGVESVVLIGSVRGIRLLSSVDLRQSALGGVNTCDI